jgi:hypothetical protein
MHGPCYTNTGCIRSDHRGALEGEFMHPDLIKTDHVLNFDSNRGGEEESPTVILTNSEFNCLQQHGMCPSKMIFTKATFDAFCEEIAKRDVNIDTDQIKNTQKTVIVKTIDTAEKISNCRYVPTYDVKQYETATLNVKNPQPSTLDFY